MAASILANSSPEKPCSERLCMEIESQLSMEPVPMMCSTIPRTSISLYPKCLSAVGTPRLMMRKEPPPASVLYWTKLNWGSTPVVSHAITIPIVPVGAMTVVCAFRYPCSIPRLTARSHDDLAASRRSFGQRF